MIDERAVSVTATYALNLAIATVLIAGLLTVTGDLVEDRRGEAIRSELTVVGNRVAADLMSADRLAGAGTDSADVRIETTLPGRVGGSHYTLAVNATTAESHLRLRSVDPRLTVTVPFENGTAVRNGTVAGGDVTIALADDGRLEVAG